MTRGQCLCGAVSFEIEGPLSPPTACHCGMCRRHSGALGAYTSAPVSAYHLRGAENLVWYRSSHDAERGFCRHCGSKLFWREVDGKALDVTMGSLDAPTGLRLSKHIWARHQGDYYEIGHDGVARYAESSAKGAPPIGAEQPAQAGPRKTEQSGRCECGAVRYRVSGNMRDVVVCHCGQCRRVHGHAPGYSAARKAELTIEGAENIAWYRSSDSAHRGFCKRCGSSLFWRPEGRETISIAAGSLEAPTGLQTVRHIFAGDKSDYYEIADGVPQDPGSMAGNPVTF
jgi:hypothetical protein